MSIIHLKHVKREAFQPYLDAGYDLIPLHRYDATHEKKTKDGSTRIVFDGKRPRDNNWTKGPYDAKSVVNECVRANRNVGVRLPDTIVVFDIDPRHDGNEGWDDFTMEYGLDEAIFPCVVTGSGGRHYYAKIPAGTKVVDTLPAFKGVEFKSKGRQVVAAGSIHPEALKHYARDPESPPFADTPDLPTHVLRAITRPERTDAAPGGGELNQEQLAKALSRLKHEDFRDHDKWLKLMMGSHHATEGDGRQEFIDWCTDDPEYAGDAEIIGRRWDSCHTDRGGGEVATIGTLRYFLAEANALDVLPADQESAKADFADFEDEDYDMTEEEAAAVSASLREWQWIADSMQFIHEDGLQRWNDRQFKMLHGHLSPKGDVVTDIQRGKIMIRKFPAQVYIPKGDVVLQHEGRTVFNIWRPSAMQPKAGDHQWFLDHVAYMFPDKESRQHVLDFMAQLIQRPEVKINFALLIQSGQGIGKGALAMILRSIIGKRNCVEPSNDEVTKAWTGWQEGAQLAIINELMAGGRADVLNRLKSPITEDTLRIEKKFGNAFEIPNHMNLFCMTNYKDALPMEQGDRRWLVLFSSATPQQPAYYDALFQNIAHPAKPAAVMHYLLHHKVKFNPKAPAPLTAAKLEMGERARSDVEAFLQAAYEQRRAPFDFPLVRVESIVGAIKDHRPHEKSMNAAAMKFLDNIAARTLRRYKKGRDGLPSYQLYAIRDAERWDAEEPINTMRAYIAHYSDDDDDDDFG